MRSKSSNLNFILINLNFCKYFYIKLKAVTLASYCLQAEYDSQQREKDTVDYLKTLLPFPKHMVHAGLLETLTEEVLNQNFNFQNLTQSNKIKLIYIFS